MSFLTKEEKFIVNQIIDSIWLNQNINLFRADDDEVGIHINQNQYYINKNQLFAGKKDVKNINLVLNKKHLTKTLFSFGKKMYESYQKKEKNKDKVFDDKYSQLLKATETFFSNLTYNQNRLPIKKFKLLKLYFDILKKEDDQLHDHLFKALIYSDKIEFWGNLNDNPGISITNKQDVNFYIYLNEETNRDNLIKKYFITYRLKDKNGEYNVHKAANYKDKMFFALLKKMVRINELRNKEAEILINQQTFLENCPEYHLQQIEQAITKPKTTNNLNKV